MRMHLRLMRASFHDNTTLIFCPLTRGAKDEVISAAAVECRLSLPGLFESGDSYAVFALAILTEAEFLDGRMALKVLLNTASEDTRALAVNDIDNTQLVDDGAVEEHVHCKDGFF